MSMSEPGLDLHEWETRWQEIEEALADDPVSALSEACDLVEEMLLVDDGADELAAAYRAARETVRPGGARRGRRSGRHRRGSREPALDPRGA